MKTQNNANHGRMEGKITVALLILFGWTIYALYGLYQEIGRYGSNTDGLIQ